MFGIFASMRRSGFTRRLPSFFIARGALQRACTRARNSFCISATAVEAMRLARAL